MRCGIISDSHDNLPALTWALELLKKSGAESIIHAGDLVSPFTLEPFKSAGLPSLIILGNNEGERKLISERFGAEGFEIYEEPFSTEMMEKSLTICHRPETAERFIGNVDVVIFGHTHQLLIDNQKGSLIINPGELGGWLFGRKTAVLLDLPSMETKVLEMD